MYDPYRENGAELAVGIRRAHSLEDLFGQCDVVSLHLPLSSATEKLINAEVLSHSKPGLILVNTARGPIIDLDGLYEALRADHVQAVGLDVLPEEPANPDHPLIKAWQHMSAAASSDEPARVEAWLDKNDDGDARAWAASYKRSVRSLAITSPVGLNDAGKAALRVKKQDKVGLISRVDDALARRGDGDDRDAHARISPARAARSQAVATSRVCTHTCPYPPIHPLTHTRSPGAVPLPAAPPSYWHAFVEYQSTIS